MSKGIPGAPVSGEQRCAGSDVQGDCRCFCVRGAEMRVGGSVPIRKAVLGQSTLCYGWGRQLAHHGTLRIYAQFLIVAGVCWPR